MIRSLTRLPVAFAVALLIGLASMTSAPRAQAINTLEIAQSALSTDCLDYSVLGICVWLHCSWHGCSIRTSVLVKHRIPELVVSAYQNTGDNPWTEMALLSPPLGDALGGGQGNERTAGDEHTNTRFKNVDAIGHPSELFNKFLEAFGVTCKSPAQPFFPYFLSTLDVLAWRSGIPETVYPEALIPGRREMGAPGDMWSPIYPRSGFVSQYHDYKAAATTAQRAADIVTRRGQPHVYRPLVPGDGKGRWPPDPVMEGDSSTHVWQRLEPNGTSSCSIFPDGGQDYRLREPGNYVWTLWRPYKCCKKRGQKLLKVIGG